MQNIKSSKEFIHSIQGTNRLHPLKNKKPESQVFNSYDDRLFILH